MLRVLVIVAMAVVTVKLQDSPAEQQVIEFKEKTSGPIAVMTTSAGSPIEYNDAVNTLNSNLIFNEYFMDSLTHFNRERLPERVVHAKGGGAFGYFEVTHDITDICKARLFSAVGKKTSVAARFSTVIIERGGSDTSREPRGFAVKFYTEEGNLDIVGFSTPMFPVKDPLLLTALVRALKKNPVTNLPDRNTMWDFLTLHPESLHAFLLIFGDPGIPDGYRHMPGYGIHTFQVVNKHGENSFIRFHFLPDAGIKNVYSEEAMKIAGEDLDYATRDLYNAIGNGNFPSWNVSIQVLSPLDVKNASFDVFDTTKVLPKNKYPLRPLGKLVLNKNPDNYFAQIEQLAFCPANLVPGILGGCDKLFEARRLAYRDAQYYRLGANFNKIAVNCPIRTKAFTYDRDGRAPVSDNERGIPNYFPNTFHGPVPYVDKKRGELIKIYQDDPNNFEQSTDLYINEMTEEERSRLIENLVTSLREVTEELQDRAVNLFTVIHPDLGYRISQGLQVNGTDPN